MATKSFLSYSKIFTNGNILAKENFVTNEQLSILSEKENK